MAEREPQREPQSPRDRLQARVNELNEEIEEINESIKRSSQQALHQELTPEIFDSVIQQRKEIARREADTWWIGAMFDEGIDSEVILQIEKRKQENQIFSRLENSFYKDSFIPPHESKRRFRRKK